MAPSAAGHTPDSTRSREVLPAPFGPLARVRVNVGEWAGVGGCGWVWVGGGGYGCV